MALPDWKFQTATRLRTKTRWMNRLEGILILVGALIIHRMTDR
jgi:hypothetical protein